MIGNVTAEFLAMIRKPIEKNINYLFILPQCVNDVNEQYIFPCGFGYVVSALKVSGRNVFTINLNYKDKYEDIIKALIDKHSIDVVLTGGLSGQYNQIFNICSIAKAYKPDVTLVVGGGIITADPIIAMTALENCDFGVIAEGEITLNDLAFAIESGGAYRDVKGIVYKNDIEWEITDPRPEISNLDCLPFPDYEGLEFGVCLTKQMNNSLFAGASNVASINLVASRSCPFNCTFCFHSSGQTYRRRSVENLMSELNFLKKSYSFNAACIIDELFVSSPQWLNEFCKKIKPYGLNIWAQMRVTDVKKESLQKLVDCGLTVLNLGVESADNSILKSMRKHINIEQINEAFVTADKIEGVEAIGNLIFGDIEETEQTLQNSLDWYVAHPNWKINLGWILVFPGSYLYKFACESGKIIDPVKYLREGLFTVNVSKMSDIERTNATAMVSLHKAIRGNSANTKMSVIDFIKILKSNLLLLMKEYTIGYWATTKESVEILHLLTQDSIKEFYFINIDRNYSGKMFYGEPVYTPEIITEGNINCVLSANNIMYFDGIKRICEIEYSDKITKVIHISELLNLN